uniref:Ig-like domain-containing protein n=1 Tax=Acanthochromis polyacanthus TaxID=80966 RepID=A0A3Q1GD37_9TELE
KSQSRAGRNICVTEMPPRFINPICDMETPEGTTIMFECSLMGIPSPIVSWFKGDKKIPHNNKKYLHSSDGDNHFLKICKVGPQDSGVYTCRAINVVGETLCRASLIVLNAKAFSGKTRGRELTAVSLGSAKVQPQKFDLMVAGGGAADPRGGGEGLCGSYSSSSGLSRSCQAAPCGRLYLLSGGESGPHRTALRSH